jgi:serine protease inhibitor
VSDATHGKITEIIDDSTASQAALALVNAIYFKGLWELAFDK